MRLQLERLEDRNLLSTTISEAEPNDSIATANSAPLGMDAGEDTRVIVKGAVGSHGDRDWVRVELSQGDVIGAAVKGLSSLNPAVSLMDSAGALLMFNDDHGFFSSLLPPESPLPNDLSHATNSVFYYVINTAGTYLIKIAASGDAGSGDYHMELAVARPALEAQPVGTRQILFIDFDGATTKLNGGKSKTLSPLSSFLPGWGLTAADENAVIDAILATIRENLADDVRARGLNGDFARTGVPGQFDIEIRNSRDHANDFGKNPFVSRIIIGGSLEEFGTSTIGLSAFVDPGNFSTDDDAVVLLDRLSGPASDPESLNRFEVGSSRTKIELVGLGVGQIAAHEAGHYFGNWHTDFSMADPFAGVANLMDPARINLRAIGPDGILGSDDDVDVDLGVDIFSGSEVFRGIEETLNVVAFGLSTGRGSGRSASSAIGSSSGGAAAVTAFGFEATSSQSEPTAYHPSRIIVRFQPEANVTSGAEIAVDFTTANGTARASEDYQANYATLIFNPGETTKAVTVWVLGDMLAEEDETFYLDLSGTTGALLKKSRSLGSILNDEP
jgi:hypothetical protein